MIGTKVPPKVTIHDVSAGPLTLFLGSRDILFMSPTPKQTSYHLISIMCIIIFFKLFQNSYIKDDDFNFANHVSVVETELNS